MADVLPHDHQTETATKGRAAAVGLDLEGTAVLSPRQVFARDGTASFNLLNIRFEHPLMLLQGNPGNHGHGLAYQLAPFIAQQRIQGGVG